MGTSAYLPLFFHFCRMHCRVCNLFKRARPHREQRWRHMVHCQAIVIKWKAMPKHRDIEYSCKQSGVNCAPIQRGGNCFYPNTVVSHASYTMNLYYKAAGKHTWDCHFGGTGMIVTQDPSYGSCSYPL